MLSAAAASEMTLVQIRFISCTVCTMAELVELIPNTTLRVCSLEEIYCTQRVNFKVSKVIRQWTINCYN